MENIDYWIESKDSSGDWVPFDRAKTHRDALKRLSNQRLSNPLLPFRLVKVTWEIIDDTGALQL